MDIPPMRWAVAGLLPEGLTIFAARPKTGKANACSLPILTSRGWVFFGDLQVGDSVYTHDGSLTEVTGQTEVMTDLSLYRVTFADGQEVVCSEAHEWTVNVRRQGAKTLETVDMLTDHSVLEGFSTIKGVKYPRYRHKYSVSVPEPLDIPKADLPVPPYTFGFWLGNGTRGSGEISTHADDVYSAVRSIRRDGFDVNTIAFHEERTTGVFTVISLGARLRAMGVNQDKTIPPEYLLSSKPQRLALLRGLMDTDGHCPPKGRVCEFSSMDRHLAEAVTFLVRSLGAKTSGVRIGRAMLNGVDYGEKYRVMFASEFNPFSVPRKRDAFIPRKGTRSSTNAIVKIEPVPTESVRCIEVADPSGIYLVGPGLIPTHNSWMSLNIATAVSHGQQVFGMMDCEQGDVLYLALEDPYRRLKERYLQMTEGKSHAGAERLTLQNISTGIGETLPEDVRQWVKESENPRLVIIDTLSKVRPRRGKAEDMYLDSYDDMSKLKALADDLRIAIMVIHHTRKGTADDALEEVLGSTGFTGAADSILVLKKRRGDSEGILLVTGRDIDELAMQMHFDADMGSWVHDMDTGFASGFLKTKDSVINWAMAHLESHPQFTPGEVAEGCGLTKEGARMSLVRLQRAGKIVRVKLGVYRLPALDEGEAQPLILEGEDHGQV